MTTKGAKSMKKAREAGLWFNFMPSLTERKLVFDGLSADGRQALFLLYLASPEMVATSARWLAPIESCSVVLGISLDLEDATLMAGKLLHDISVCAGSG